MDIEKNLREPVAYEITDEARGNRWVMTIKNPERYAKDYPELKLLPLYDHTLLEELETLRAENAKLIAERKEYLVSKVFESSDKKLLANHGFTDFIDLLAAYEKLLAERDGFEESYRNLFNKRSSRVVHLMDAVDKKLSEINCTEDIRQTVYETIRFYGCGEVADLKLKIERLESEREAMARQEHALKVCEQHLDCYRKVVRGPLPPQQKMLDVRSSFYDWALSKGLSIDSVWSSHGEPFEDEDTQTCWEIWQAAQSVAHPLPAQQIPDTLSSDDFVPMPSNADQASWMMAIGESWLERNAPERLNPHRVGLHIDDFAVNQFADSMKKKLAISREKEKSGWNDPLSCKVSYLAELLISHLPKGDPVDVANFAMMLHLRDGGHDALKEAANKIKQIPEEYALVPAVANFDMLYEGVNSLGRGLYKCGNYAQIVSNLWKDMLSASQPKGESIERPTNCRNRLRDEGKAYPRSGCYHCKTGGLTGCPFDKSKGDV